VIRALAAGLTLASRTSSWPMSALSTTVSSLMTAGQVPMECRIRAPGAGQFELTARIRLLPTTHPEYVQLSARTFHALADHSDITSDSHGRFLELDGIGGESSTRRRATDAKPGLHGTRHLDIRPRSMT
jgi:hypothetical protein